MLNSFTHFAFEPEELGLVFASEQIFRDYKEFLKVAVMPEIEAEHGIRLREVLTLVCVDSAVQPISSKDVATIIRQDPATMSRSTVILIGKKYIRTSRNIKDHRSKILNITPDGRRVADHFRTIVSERFDKLHAFQIPHSTSDNMSDLRFNMIVPFQERARQLMKASAIPSFRQTTGS